MTRSPVVGAVLGAARAVRSAWIEASLALGDLTGMAAQRRRLGAALQGRVLDLGGGSGRNLPHLGAADVVVVADPDEAALRRARRRRATRPVVVVAASGERLPFADGAFDAVVVALALCTIPDAGAALREVHRVLVPGGELRYLEHVVSPRPWLARVQHAVDPAWGVLAAGCSLTRRTDVAVRAAGFDVVAEHRSGDGQGAIVSGRARRRP